MTTALEYYADAFNSESLYGLRIIIAWFSVAVFIWLIGLSYLVWKADSKSTENRFMSVLLIIEGIKAAFLLPDAFPYDSSWEWLWNYLWVFKIDVFFYAHTTAILLYLCIPIYYRIERLKFMHRPSFQKHAWYLAPLFGFAIWMSIRGLDSFYMANSAWLICAEAGATPQLQVWWGSIQPYMTEAVAEIGTCSTYYESHLVDEPMGLWTIALASPLVTLGALFFIRSSMKSEKEAGGQNSTKHLTSRSLYIGFLGKVSGTMLYFATLMVIIPILNGGDMATFLDATIWQYGDDTSSIDRLKYLIWTLSLLMTPLAMGFEALMFVHAALNESVFGIDQNLRKTFRAATFTGIGALSFIVGTEVMEQLVGAGLLGGVGLGLGFLAIRSPVLSVIDQMSNRLIPSAYTTEENAYLDAYNTAMEDRIITPEERKLLQSLAVAYSLSQSRVDDLESDYNNMLEEE
ncbi:MAG: hypothetical protein ACJZ40_05075 [Candidatus Poseidoniaceae archaeon]